MAMFKARAQDVVRVYVSPARVPEAGPLLKHCAMNKLAYHVVEDDELERITGSGHHEGICVLAKAPPGATWQELEGELRGDPAAAHTLVALENVNNPHNVGAIARVAAHFGVRWLLCLGTTPHERSAALVRTAEGAAEHVKMLHHGDAKAAVTNLKHWGVKVLATSHRAERDLGGEVLPARHCWVMGAEAGGLSPEVMKLADARVKIGGAGWVESLNVACATSTLLGESWRQAHVPSPPLPARPPAPAAARPVPGAPRPAAFASKREGAPPRFNRNESRGENPERRERPAGAYRHAPKGRPSGGPRPDARPDTPAGGPRKSGPGQGGPKPHRKGKPRTRPE